MTPDATTKHEISCYDDLDLSLMTLIVEASISELQYIDKSTLELRQLLKKEEENRKC